MRRTISTIITYIGFFKILKFIMQFFFGGKKAFLIEF